MVLIIIQITNDECEYLLSRGWRWKEHLHKTYSAANKKFATENYKLLRDLEKYRRRKLAK